MMAQVLGKRFCFFSKYQWSLVLWQDLAECPVSKSIYHRVFGCKLSDTKVLLPISNLLLGVVVESSIGYIFIFLHKS